MDLRRWELKLVVHPDRVSVIGVICVQEKITDIASKVAPKVASKVASKRWGCCRRR